MNFVNSVQTTNVQGILQSITNKLPNAPTLLAYVANSATVNSVTISFTAPTNVPIISYTASTGPSSGTPSSYTISGLTSNTSYNLTLIANGIFKSSASSSPALSILTKPDAPTIGTVTVSTTTASVPFTAPSGNGTITGYTATSSPGGLTGTGTTSPISVAGLTGGTAYTFTITATNASGTSISSTISNNVTPAAAASTTMWVAVGAGNGTAGTGILWSTTPTVSGGWNYATFSNSTVTAVNEWVRAVEYNPTTGTYIAGSITLNMLYISSNGMVWTAKAVTFATYRLRYFSGPNVWVSLSAGTTYSVSLNDGATWTTYTPSTSILWTYDIDYDGTKFIMVGGGNLTGRPVMMTTTNITSNSWTINITYTGTASTPINYIIAHLRYYNGIWVAGGQSNPAGCKQMYSTNGVDWIPATTQITYQNGNNSDSTYDVTNNRFVLCARLGIAMSSTGVNWSALTTIPFTRFIYSTRTFNNIWVVGTDANTPGSLSTSPDGINWTHHFSPSLGVIFSVTYSHS